MANNETLIPIPGRLHSVATEGHVAGADEIIDDTLGKDQATINSEVNTALGTGGTVDQKIAAALGDVDAKINEAVASEASQRAAAVSGVQNSVNAETSRAQAAEENLRQLYNSLSQSQPIPVTSLPATGEAGKIYRLAGTNSYADYMYAEGALTTPIKMAEYDNAIDDEPTAGSDNIVKSGGVYNSIQEGINEIVTDEGGGNLMPKSISDSDILYDTQLNNVGTTEPGSNFRILNIGIPIEGNTTYVFGNKETLEIAVINKIVFKQTNDLYNYELDSWAVNVASAFTTPPNAKYLFFQQVSSDNPYTGFNNIQLQKGTIPVAVKKLSLNEEIYISPYSEKNIVCWGDSLTAGAGSAQTTNFSTVKNKLQSIFPSRIFPNAGGYGDFLKAMLFDYTLRICGVGGESINTIAAREGANPPVVQGSFVLPADGSVASIGNNLTSVWNEAVSPLVQGVGEYDTVNPCYIQGIPCTLSLSEGVYYLKRNSAGDRNVTIPDGTILNLGGEKVTFDCGIAILWCYQNGGFSNDGNTLVEKITKMVNNLRTKKYIVINCHAGGWIDMDAYLKNAFGNKLLDWRNYASSNALYDFGITPTEQDLTDMSNHIAPTSIRYDATHLNSAGYAILAYQIYLKGQQLGYWK